MLYTSRVIFLKSNAVLCVIRYTARCITFTLRNELTRIVSQLLVNSINLRLQCQCQHKSLAS